MKATTYLLLLISVPFFFFFKNDHPSGIQRSTVDDKSAIFKVTMDAVVKQDDDFSLYYTEDGSANFSTKKIVWTAVKGNPTSQKISFTFPENVKPTQLRIDFGNNKNQEAILFEKFKMQYNGKSFEAPGTLIFSYFRPDVKKTIFDAETGIIRGAVQNGIRQSPSFYPKEGPLGKQLKLLTE